MKRYNQLPVNNQCKESSVSIHHRACATSLAGCGARQRPLGLGAELLPPTGNAGLASCGAKIPTRTRHMLRLPQTSTSLGDTHMCFALLYTL